MPRVNNPTSGHVGPAPCDRHKYGGPWQWLPYTDLHLLHTLNQAIHIIDSRIKGHKPCNEAFKALPGKRTFAQCWADPSVWISYDPYNASHDYGATLDHREITITRFALRMGRWTVAGACQRIDHLHQMCAGDAVRGRHFLDGHTPAARRVRIYEHTQ